MEEEKDRASDECVREREREKKGARAIDGGMGKVVEYASRYFTEGEK